MNPSVLIKAVKKIEYLLFTIAFVCLGITFYGMMNCGVSNNTDFCSNWGIGKTDSVRAIFVLLPIYGILNSIHVGLDHYLNVGNQSYTNLFNIGLFGLSMSFILFAFFKISPLLLPVAQQNLVLALIYLVITLTTAVLLSDTNLWHKDSLLVKYRILSSLIYLITSASIAGLGVLIGLIILPLNLVIDQIDQRD